MLCTQAANKRYALQRAFLAGWDYPWASVEKDAVKLYSIGLDLNFSYEGTIQCNCSNSVVSDKITFSTQACTGDNKKVINGQCTTGYRQDLTSISDGSGGYICTYRYAFLDGSFSNNFTEPTTTPCITA